MAIAGVKRAIQLLVLFLSPLILNTYFSNHPSANVPTSWQNFYHSDRGSWKFNDNTHVRPILALDLNGQPSFGFGFLRNGTTNAFYLVTLKIAIRPNSSFSDYGPPPVVLWSANPNRPVEENATLELTVNGKLVLTDVDGTPVWSANTSGTFVTGMNLSLGGNLKLVNGSGSVVWQSYRFPTNTWLPEQRLRIGRNLHASVSMSNLSSGMFYLSITRGGINAYIKSVPPQLYKTLLRFHANNATPLRFGIGSLTLSSNYVTYNQIEKGDFQFMRMEPDGHLNVYQLIDGYKVTLYSDLLKDEHYGDCAYPTVCGNYGVCFEGQCSCAGGGSSIYFRQLNATAASFGCREVTPLSCPDAQLHTFLEVMNVTCFNFAPQLSNIDAESCRRECLKNCSCKAAMFRYQDNTSIGTCYLPSHIFSLMAIRKEVFNYNALAFIKVQRSTHKKSKSSLVSVLGPERCDNRSKGTPGYMAPEFIRGRNFSAKIDVYSFGILILEIIGGRKNRDSTQVDYLIDMVKVKAEEGQLSDLVDDRNEDMQCHKEEAVKLQRIGISCLQTDHHKRPSVSQVIHVLEGSMDVEPITDYSFLSMFPMDSPLEANRAVSAPLIASVLSGPR
ncbi:hypothetical protein VitviT2T_029411 [Vitis vinifera]|uniref:Uncharacterized protein n=1 Tax=Vitis vinifera TaxID=29760 RepID=A0ABY9DW92_VITVI|nr:hypothetical protein VitviT2T_029411 [Vitis vinifera]